MKILIIVFPKRNVLIDDKGRALLSDFGLSVILGGFANLSCTYTGGKMGMPIWAAPELFFDEISLSKEVQPPKASTKCDMYSFACLMIWYEAAIVVLLHTNFMQIFSGRYPWMARSLPESLSVMDHVRNG